MIYERQRIAAEVIRTSALTPNEEEALQLAASSLGVAVETVREALEPIASKD